MQQPYANRRDPASDWTAFCLSGVTIYSLICGWTLGALCWGVEAGWGYYWLLIYGLWSVPLAGYLAAVIHSITPEWSWLPKRRAWNLMVFELVIAVLTWVSIWF